MKTKLHVLLVFSVFSLLLFLSLAHATPALNPIGNKAVSENSTLTFTITTNNQDINTTAFFNTTLSSNPMRGAVLTKNNDSRSTFSWTPSFADAGVYTVNFSVTDTSTNLTNTWNSTSSAGESINITVTNVNRAPVLSQIGNKTVNEETLLQFTISGADPDGDALTFSAANLPLGAVFNTATRTFSWTPNSQQSGTYQASFTASDGSLTASEAVTITVNDVPSGMSVSALTFGGRTQQRSNPRSDNDIDVNVLVTGSVTVTNTGSDTITGLNVSSITPTGGFSASSLNITVISISQTTLNRSESATITFSARIPEALDAVDTSLAEAAFNVATITMRGVSSSTGATITKTSSATMQAKNNLKLKDIRLTVDGGDSKAVSRGDTIKNIKPGSKISLEVSVENRFNRDDNVDLQDVEIRASNDDLDIDESETLSDIGPRKTKTESLEFTIDESADRDEFEIVLEADTNDENGARHGEKFRFSLKVEREEHEILITRADLSPSSVSCESSSDLRVTVKNTGQNDEDDVFIRVASPDLNFGQITGPIQMDEDDSKTSIIQIPMHANITAGTKRITVESYYDSSEFSDREIVLLQISKCGGEPTPPPVVQPPAPPKSNDTVIIIQQPPKDTVTAEPPKEEKGFTESPYYIPLLIAANLLLLGIAVLVIARLLNR